MGVSGNICNNMNVDNKYKSVIEWCRQNKGKLLESPRKKAFKTRPLQDFYIINIDEYKEKLKVQFKKLGTILPLEFWRIKESIDFLSDYEDYAWIGARITDIDHVSLEKHLKSISKQKYGRTSDIKTAPHIGDLLVLSNIAEYGWTLSPHDRKVQGIKLRRMLENCILCGSAILKEHHQQYIENKKKYCKLTRYQSIIDKLIDSRDYDKIYFDHETELPTPYRTIAKLNRNALQEEKIKGRKYQKKWPDICGIKDGKVRIIIEEERRPTQEHINDDINRIEICRYLWADNKFFEMQYCRLFIVINENTHDIQESIEKNRGYLKKVVICDKESFSNRYDKEKSME